MVEDAISHMTGKLDRLVAQVFKEALTGIVKKHDHNLSMFFVQGALQRAITEVLTSTMGDDAVQEAFKAAQMHVTTNVYSTSANLKALVKVQRLIAPIARFIAS